MNTSTHAPSTTGGRASATASVQRDGVSGPWRWPRALKAALS